MLESSARLPMFSKSSYKFLRWFSFFSMGNSRSRTCFVQWSSQRSVSYGFQQALHRHWIRHHELLFSIEDRQQMYYVLYMQSMKINDWWICTSFHAVYTSKIHNGCSDPLFHGVSVCNLFLLFVTMTMPATICASASDISAVWAVSVHHQIQITICAVYK
jgi:hypothetical protein